MLLAPYRVLDLTDEKGLYCGKILGDLGADVIKIEKPRGDQARNRGPFYHDTPHPERSLYWTAYNAGKRGITLNVEARDGREILLKLAKNAHCLIESFPVGYMDGLGLGWRKLNEMNPGIIMTSITPFGQAFPHTGFGTSDLAMQALGGAMSRCGDPDTPLLFAGSSDQSYLQAGAQAAVGTMIALFHREMTGQGQQVDVSMVEAMFWGASPPELLADWELKGRVSPREGNYTHRGETRYKVIFPCKDGYVASRVMVGLQGHFTRRLVDLMKEEGMAEDLDGVAWEQLDIFMIQQDSLTHYEEVMTKFFLRHTQSELQQKAIERGLILFPVYEPCALVDNPQVVSRGILGAMEVPGLSENVVFPVKPYLSSAFSPGPTTRPPLIGEHNEEVYCGELGFSKEDLARLMEAGAI